MKIKGKEINLKGAIFWILVSLALILLLVSMVSAQYPGECYKINFPNTDSVNFSLISNTSSFQGFNWSKVGYEITYCFSTDFIPGNYTFEWSNYQDSITIPSTSSSSSSSGGSSSGNQGVKIIEQPYIKENEVIKIVPNDPEIIEKAPKWMKKALIISIILLFFMAVYEIFLLNKLKKS